MSPDAHPLAGSRTVVTGASGFIGRPLCRALAGLGAEVHALCRTDPGLRDDRIDWRGVDLEDPLACRSAFADLRADLVFHLCSYAQGEVGLDLVSKTFRGEVLTTVNVLTSVAEVGCGRLVTAGSLEEPEPGQAPSSPYAAAKAASRGYAQMFFRTYGLPIAMTRIFMTYGPGQSPKKVVAHCVEALHRGLPLEIASPERLVDWIYVDDVVRGLLAVAAAPGIEGRSLDLGSGELVSIRDVASRLRAIVDPNADVRFSTSPTARRGETRRADVRTTCDATGWRPAVSLDEGLERTVAHYAGGACSSRSPGP